MALTIDIEGKGIIANADASPDTAMSGSLWDELGAGTDTFSTDVYLFGTTSFAGQYSAKAGWQYYDIGAANVLDFTPSTGAQTGQFLWFWISGFTLGKIATKANKGLTIRIGASLTDYREYVIAGSDDSNGWKGEWKCFVMDPTKTSTSGMGAGTQAITAIRYMGVYIDNTAAFLAPSIFISQIVCGSGIRITGTSTTGWADAVTYCTAYASRAWGMLQEREGIYYGYGKIIIGSDNVAPHQQNTTFAGLGKVIQFGSSQYWNGSAWVTSYPINAGELVIEDHASYTTSFTDGVAVGTDKGRAGCTYIGNSIMNVSVKLYGGNNAASVTALYGTKFQNITGPITWGNDADHICYSVAMVGCAQFNPVGAVKIRNCLFSEVAPISGAHSAALLWNSNIDIQACGFIANNDPNATYVGHAIKHAVDGTFAYTGLTFSGNEKDVWYSYTGANNLIVNADPDSNPGSASYTNDSSGTVTINSSVNITITVQNAAQQPIQYAQVGVFLLDSPFTQIMNEDTLVTGIATESYTGSTPVDIVIKVRKSDDLDSPRYIPFSTTGEVGTSGFVLTITLKENKFI